MKSYSWIWDVPILDYKKPNAIWKSWRNFSSDGFPGVCFDPPTQANTTGPVCDCPYLLGENCIYPCSPGYHAISGDAIKRTCRTDGSWTEPDMFCQGMKWNEIKKKSSVWLFGFPNAISPSHHRKMWSSFNQCQIPPIGAIRRLHSMFCFGLQIWMSASLWTAAAARPAPTLGELTTVPVVKGLHLTETDIPVLVDHLTLFSILPCQHWNLTEHPTEMIQYTEIFDSFV